MEWDACQINYFKKGKVAIKNAKRLQKHNDTTNSKNPATDMHELIEYLINLKNFSRK